MARRVLLAVLFALVALVQGGTAIGRADSTDENVRRIARQLRCPICESVSVADSPAELAVQMRSVIRKKVEAGDSDQEIIDYFVAAYGDSVLLEPPRRGLGWAIWLGPLVAFAGGAAILGLFMRAWVRPGARPNRRRGWRAGGVGRPGVRAQQARQELEAARESLSR